MKSAKLLSIYLIVFIFFIPFFAHSEDIQSTVQSFEIQHGIVTMTPGFCIPDSCIPTPARLTGRFSAEIKGDSITFSNANLRSSPETGFNLPETPNEESSGAIHSATFSFDGVSLVVKGVIDSRAFDGPLYEYEFTAQASDALGFDAKGYYTAREDFRRCISPICGGVFVKAVNRRFTKCADGRRRDECYVAKVNWEELGFDPFTTNEGIYPSTPILLKGKLIPRNYEGFGNLGEIVVTDAYKPATNNLPDGIFAALENNGIVCITSPCFSVDEYVLNRRKIRVISGFDLNPVGASEEDLATAYSLFSNNSPMIVTGYNKRQRELHGIGISFFANQLYLPILPPAQ
jgi:hypothetical protein